MSTIRDIMDQQIPVNVRRGYETLVENVITALEEREGQVVDRIAAHPVTEERATEFLQTVGLLEPLPEDEDEDPIKALAQVVAEVRTLVQGELREVKAEVARLSAIAENAGLS